MTAPAFPSDHELAARRHRMVRRDLADRGVRDERVLAAMGAVHREDFVPSGERRFAYDDRPLPIGEGQTISQPHVVALMLEALELAPGDRLLEVGSGSGYAAAVAGRLCATVVGIERIAVLAAAAAARLQRLGVVNVRIVEGDGTLGWPPGAPYDAILVSAAGPTVPHHLVDQLGEGGRLVIPVGRAGAQRLVRVRRTPGGPVEDDLGLVAFVPLVGAEGWPDPDPDPEPRARAGGPPPSPGTADPP